MESFDGSRRRDPLTPAERRSPRQSEPLEQRLDRWMTTGRQLVEGVSGGRPGARQGSRRPEARPGGRGNFDGLGRWVEDRLDWLLDDSDDWPEPWQQHSERRRSGPDAPAPTERPRQPEQAAGRREPSRRPLQAISRRGGAQSGLAAPAASARPLSAGGAWESPGAATGTGAAAAGRSDRAEDWPDDETFSVPRWQRPSAPLQRPDPLQIELQQRDRDPRGDQERPASSPARPLPRSSRRR